MVFTKAYSEWRYYQYEMNKLKKESIFDYPACYKEQHSVHIDGIVNCTDTAKYPSLYCAYVAVEFHYIVAI